MGRPSDVAGDPVELIEAGGPGWLNLLVLLALWDMLKMLWIGPVSLVLLIHARGREAVAARRAHRVSDASDGNGAQAVLVGSGKLRMMPAATYPGP